MKIEWNRKYTTISIYAILTSAAIMLIAAMVMNLGAVKNFFTTFNSILSPVYIGFAVAYLANPIMKFSEKYIFRYKIESERGFRTKRFLSILVAMLILALCIIALILLIIPQVVLSLSDLTAKLSGYLDTTINWLDNFLPESMFNRTDLTASNLFKTVNTFLSSSDIGTALASAGENGSGSIVFGSISVLKDYIPVIITYLIGLANGLFNIILGVFFAIYMLSSKEKLKAQFKKTLRAFTQEKSYNGVIELGHYANKTFGSYLLGKLLDSVIVGIIVFIACAIFRVPYAILLSTLIAITNIIPVIGPFIGAVPGVLIIFIVDPAKVLVFILINLIVQQIDGNIIVPKLLGETTGLDSLWVLFSITVMGGIWGMFGMFICVPIFAILYMLFKLMIEKRLATKELPVETSEYYSEREFRSFTEHEDNKNSFASRIKRSREKIHSNTLGARIKKLFKKSAPAPDKKDEVNDDIPNEENSDN